MIKGFFYLFPFKEKERILIISDEQDLNMLKRSYLLRKGFEVFIAADLPEALTHMKEYRPDIILVTSTEAADFEDKLAELRRRAPDSYIRVDSEW